jgi:hypothetical protein
MLRKILSSQTGFSIIQGMMLAAAVAGMAYVGTKLTTDQKLAQKGSESKSRVEQLHAMIYSVMQNKDHCTRTFGLAGIVPAASSCFKAPPATVTSCTDMVNSPGVLWTKDSTAANPVFKVKALSGAYDSTRVYMNNTVTINEVQINFPSNLSNHADMRILYGKLDSTDVTARTGKGFGSKTVAKTIKLKIQRNTTTNAFESCYAVDESENQDMVKDFCEGLGADNNPATPNLFQWDAIHQKCVLTDSECPSGQIFTGFDSNGQRLCYAIQDWMDFSELIDSSDSTCNAATSTDVRFVVTGSKVKIQCAAPPCTPTCPSAPASAICTGYNGGGGNDGCGDLCPIVSGTNPNTCASGLCLCTPP